MKQSETVIYVVRWPTEYELEYDDASDALHCFYDEINDSDLSAADKPVCVIRRTIIDEIIT